MDSVKIVTTERGGAAVLLNNFKFIKNKVTNCGKIKWVCEKRRRHGCKATCFTQGETTNLLEHNPEHNHEPDEKKYSVQAISNSCKRRATEELFEKPDKIMKIELELSEGKEAVTARNISNVRRNLWKARRKALPSLPKTLIETQHALDDMTITTDRGENLLLDNDKENNIVIFGTKRNVEMLMQSDTVLMDRTFDYCCDYFKQMFTIFVVKNKHCIPLLFCLLPDKKENTYEILFEKIRSILGNHNVKEVMVDFEIGIHNAVRSVWPSASILGCRFHLTQSWYTKIKKLGLSKLYKNTNADNDNDISKWLRSVFGLLFLNPEEEEVSTLFVEDLMPEMPSDSRFANPRNFKEHSHPPEENLKEVTELRHNLRLTAITSEEKPATVLKAALNNVPDSVKANLGNLKTVTRDLRRQRQICPPSSVVEIEEHLRKAKRLVEQSLRPTSPQCRSTSPVPPTGRLSCDGPPDRRPSPPPQPLPPQLDQSSERTQHRLGVKFEDSPDENPEINKANSYPSERTIKQEPELHIYSRESCLSTEDVVAAALHNVSDCSNVNVRNVSSVFHPPEEALGQLSMLCSSFRENCLPTEVKPVQQVLPAAVNDEHDCAKVDNRNTSVKQDLKRLQPIPPSRILTDEIRLRVSKRQRTSISPSRSHSTSPVLPTSPSRSKTSPSLSPTCSPQLEPQAWEQPTDRTRQQLEATQHPIFPGFEVVKVEADVYQPEDLPSDDIPEDLNFDWDRLCQPVTTSFPQGSIGRVQQMAAALLAKLPTLTGRDHHEVSFLLNVLSYYPYMVANMQNVMWQRLNFLYTAIHHGWPAAIAASSVSPLIRWNSFHEAS